MPRRLLIRAGKEPWIPLSPETTLSHNVLGTNSGNLLFSTAVFAALGVEGNQTRADYFQVERNGDPVRIGARLRAEFDHLVLPFANAFRGGFARQLDRWTDVIERADLPVSVLGVGGQFRLGEDPPSSSPEVAAAARRFVRAVLDRSPSIGVRGPVTAAYLRSLGFPDDAIEQIGCPSLYRPDVPARMSRCAEGLGDDARIVLNLTPRIRSAGTEPLASLVRRTVDDFDDVLYVAQENQDLDHLLWAAPFAETSHPDLPRHPGHRLLNEDRTRIFVDERTWRHHIADYDFAVGNRIHGTIASVLAGLPAVVLPFDSRTAELAEVHALPRTRLSELEAGLTCRELYEQVDADRFNRAHKQNLRRYVRFLERHDLAHGFDRETTVFQEQMRAVSLPAAVGPVTAGGPERFAERLRWLRRHGSSDVPDELREHLPEWAVRRRRGFRELLDIVRSPRRLAAALARRARRLPLPHGAAGRGSRVNRDEA
ncbi:polysaccharide pyruvyl transferase family protein [Aeromicrobium piscarium]|uniref:Polysaccharide pyruvyl transferase family protein n=1 Tax=Aeromicrobium piscarium TaxID=2590901 RepID=A0A554S7L4_9ACTN|nr:polysaccharide pyruvyl transferase family protein [Aeromicrobium piscarium]TSD62343.1 polysaccharide pyruvyl transferase family protein [Aeromicrobium piscarium]